MFLYSGIMGLKLIKSSFQYLRLCFVRHMIKVFKIYLNHIYKLITWLGLICQEFQHVWCGREAITLLHCWGARSGQSHTVMMFLSCAGRCYVMLEKGSSMSIKLVRRYKHEVFTHLLGNAVLALDSMKHSRPTTTTNIEDIVSQTIQKPGLLYLGDMNLKWNTKIFVQDVDDHLGNCCIGSCPHDCGFSAKIDWEIHAIHMQTLN